MSTSTSTNPIHKALHSLLPPSSSLPPRLISAAESLLAVSRQRASHLKPDEEIARPHVCAELACRRLRAQLRLPNIKSGNGAPCRPAVYRKLLESLEQTLGDIELLGTPKSRKQAGSTSQTPSTAGRSTGTRKRNFEALNLDEDDALVETPTKKRRTKDVLATPTKASGKKALNGFKGKILVPDSSAKGSLSSEEYVPLIRKLCTAFKTSKMVPHVYTGVCVIGELGSDDTDSQEVNENSTRLKQLSLIIAIYLLTLTKMQEGLMTTDVYDGVLQRSIQILQLDQAETILQVEDWIARVNDEEWTSLPGKGSDWWSSVPEDAILPLEMDTIAGSTDNEVITIDPDATPKARQNTGQVRKARQLSRREELKKQLEEEDPEDVLLPGLGTMMNDAVDYFSEERNADYEAWKAEILKELEARGS